MARPTSGKEMGFLPYSDSCFFHLDNRIFIELLMTLRV